VKRRLVLATLALGLATVTMLHSATPALSRERAEVPAQVPLVQAAGPLGSSCDGGEGVYLYEHDDYKGRCSKFTGDSPNPRGWHIGNDAVSSIRIVGNWTATLYEHDDYKGAHSSFSHDDPDLDNDVIGNDQVSSVRVERRSGGGPAGYSFCSREDQRCSFSGTKDVAYGADGRFSYKYRVTGGIDCNNATFGDPYSGVVKACYVRDSSGGGCVPNADQIALFVDADYGGQCVVKGLGSYANPSAIGLPNDSISSIKVGSNVKAMLCHHDNYGGQCETFTGRDSNLSNNAVGNDQVSSVRVERRSGGGPAGYSFCSHENQRCHFSGTKDVAYGTDGRFSYKYGVTGGIDCNNATFGDPYSGVVKACYVKDSSGGGCVPNADQIALFVDSNYGGQCVAKGLGSYANPNAIGLPNDSISSIKVGSNVKATLCHHDNYGGQCETFTGNDSNLSNNAVGNDQVSSVRVERRGGGGPAECPVGRYRAQYYNSASLSGNPILTRCEGGINYDWGGGGPGNGVPSDNFSVRWVGRFDFSAGDYTFIARADDGVRLWVDGHRIINAWKDQAATEYRARRSLTAGQHEVKVEYYERGGAAVAQVRWEYGPATCPEGQYCAQYYSNRSLSGNPILTRCERRINYDWGGGGPGNGVPSDNFSVRWVGRFDFGAGDYTFIARADDGVRLWVDGHRIINAWKDQAATEYRARRSLTAGQHEVKLEYYEHGGAAVAQVRWERRNASCPPRNCTQGKYAGRDFFVQVVQSLSDVPMSNFAVDALLAWKPHENTNACWNPLATTWKMESVCNFNSVGVQHYQDQNMGVRATANTINQGYYDAIRRMLRLEAFDREAVRTALGTWGTCSGRRCDSLLNKWQDLWNAR